MGTKVTKHTSFQLVMLKNDADYVKFDKSTSG